MWSRVYPACLECGGTERKHVGHGLCRLCYMRSYNAANAERVRQLDGQGRGSDTPDNSDDNLVTLCRKCHINAHRKDLSQAKPARTHCKHGHAIAIHGRHNGRQWRCRMCTNIRARERNRRRRLDLAG